jgi:membrane fusion protein (multidrug efflux system)
VGPSRRARRLFAAGLALALAAPGCGSGDGKSGPPPPPAVEVVRVESETLRDVATFSGELMAEHSVLMKPETEGVVAEVSFDEGQTVEEGQVLVRLRNQEQRARLREAQATLALAQEENKRATELVTRDAVSLAARDRALAELGVARARVELARIELDRTEIRAPFDGVVGVRLVDPGDRVDEDTALVQIDAIDRLQVAFALTEHAIAFGDAPKRVWAQVLPYPGERFPGKVFYVSPTLDPATRRVIMKAWIPNEDHRLRPGLFANVDLEIARRENAVLVPESAVVFDRHGTYVWRVDGENVASRAPVDVGLRKEGRVEISVGLQPGDLIVSAGTHKVMEGKTLRPLPPSARGQALRDPPKEASGGEGT